MALKLSDIAPVTATVTVRGQKADIYPLSIAAMGQMLYRFPELQGLASGKAIGAAEIAALGERAAGVLLAAALGHGGEEDWEAAVRLLPAGEQLDIVQACLKLTTPEGIGPFAEKLTGLISSVADRPAGKAAKGKAA